MGIYYIAILFDEFTMRRYSNHRNLGAVVEQGWGNLPYGCRKILTDSCMSTVTVIFRGHKLKCRFLDLNHPLDIREGINKHFSFSQGYVCANRDQTELRPVKMGE